MILLLSVEWRDPVEGWAVLLETNDFPEGYSDLPVDFVDVERMKTMLLHKGWQENHIFMKKDNITPGTVEEGLTFLKNADENDIILFYIASHGGYLRRELQWNAYFPALWEEFRPEKKVLIVDSCFSGSFLPQSDRPHLSLASVSAEESAWAGLPEEGLPVVGFVFTSYFCEAMRECPSVEEGFARTVPQVREYMSEVVYPAFAETYPPETFYNLYNPHPVIDDAYPGNLSLDLEHQAPLPVLFVVVGMLLAARRRR